ncbi:MAG: hypothetical protein ABIC04_02340 [Nanoarchaeota archaeon]
MKHIKSEIKIPKLEIADSFLNNVSVNYLTIEPLEFYDMVELEYDKLRSFSFGKIDFQKRPI